MTVNAINGSPFTGLSALNGRTLSTLTAVNGQAINAIATLIFDDFNRANSGTLGTCTGGTQSPQAWAGPNGTFAISSNHVLTTHAAVSYGYRFLNASLADCTIQATALVTKQNNGLWFRGNSNDGFLFVNEAGIKYTCYKVQSGTFTQLFDAGAGSPTPANGDLVKVVLLGSSITFYVNGVNEGNITNTFNQTQPNHGFYVGNNVLDDGGQWDDFTVTSP